MLDLKVSENQRFLCTSDGRPFFYLADTAWELLHRLNRVETLGYLNDRAAKGFTVIQTVALAELDGLNTPNAAGDKPLVELDPLRYNEPYWQHVDWVIEQASSLGLYVALLPTWGDKWNKAWGVGPEIFTPDNAFAYGRWLGERYRDQPIIWIVGGDRIIETPTHRQIVESMARGLREGDQGRHLITFHPQGGRGSSEVFHDSPWLDFNMWQSGHMRNTQNHKHITADYSRENPVKPVLDGEPGYEDHPSSFNVENGYLEAYDCRKSLYWSLFAGACGHTYGCHPIWQFWTPGRVPHGLCRNRWEDALSFPGSSHMRFARALLESRPYLSRIPDQSLVVRVEESPAKYVAATRDAHGTYAMIYCPFYNPVTVDLSSLSGGPLVAHWYNPRDGSSTRLAPVARTTPHHTFTPPPGGPDWVLVLDGPAQPFGPPGEKAFHS